MSSRHAVRAAHRTSAASNSEGVAACDSACDHRQATFVAVLGTRHAERGGQMGEITGAAWINGSHMPAKDASISVFDVGFIGGVSVFDTLACWQGKLFKLDTHLARFRRSAHAAAISLGDW